MEIAKTRICEKKDKFIPLLVDLLYIIILCILSAYDIGYNHVIVETLSNIGLIALVSFIILLFLSLQVDKKLNYFHLFLALCFLFSFGQSFIALFLGEVDTTRLLSIGNGNLSAKSIYNSAMYVLKAICFLTAGYIVFYKKNENLQQKAKMFKDKNHYREFKNLRLVGWVILFISIIPAFYNLYGEIVTYSTSGYLDTLENTTGINKIFSIIGGFFASSLIILLITEDRKLFRKIVYVILVIYLLLQLLGGSRISMFRYVILLVTMYLYKTKKIKFKNVIFLIIGVLCIGLIFSCVSIIRNYSGNSLSVQQIWQYLVESFSDENLFYKIFFEAGNTQIINTVVYETCPNIVDYCYGASLLKIALSVVPNLFWSVHPAAITTDSTFSSYYTSLCGLGSSIFAESYWNFGEIGAYIILFIFGGVIAKILNNLRKTFEKQNYILMFIFYYLLYYFVFMVRSDIVQLGRSFVYYCLVPIIIVELLTYLQRKRV